MRLLDRVLFYKIAPRQIRYLKHVDYTAGGLAGAVMQQMEADFVVGPPLTVHLPNPELLAGVWSMCRECLAAGVVGRTTGDVIAGVVSRLNACPYCFAIHTSMLHSFGAPELAGALQRQGDIADAETQRIAEWAGATLTPGASILESPPFTTEQAPQIIGTALCFHYLNRIVNVFLDPLPMSGIGWLAGPMSRMSGKILQPRLSSQRVAPGRFLSEAPDIKLPSDFKWAEGEPNIAGGARRFVASAEEAGRESVDPAVRDCVLSRIGTWNGENPGIGRAWLEEAVAPLADRQRPAARLALLTALAAYQVDEGVITKFREATSGDRDFINLTSWASYSAVRRIASWLSVR